MDKDIAEVKALDTLTRNVIADSLEGNGSAATAAEWKTAEVRKGRLVIRVPAPGAVSALPKECVCGCLTCVCTCVACRSGCFPCVLTA